MQRKPPRITFSGADAQSSRWVGVEIDLGGDLYRHPPSALLTMYAKKGEGSSVFIDWGPFLIFGLGVLLLAGLLWLPFVHRVTRRLRLMTEGAERISEGNFEVNVASRHGDEIGRLSRAIQCMSSRLSLFVDGQKRFLGDTAHELCSPLVRLRMGLGILSQRLEGEE